MRRILLSVLCILLNLTVCGQGKPNIRFKHLSIKDGLSQSTVDCILQDSIGFIWFGTVDGLNKFDGYSFTIYRKETNNPSSISMNDIRDLYEDKEGNIWIATNGGGLNLYDRSKDNFKHFQHDPENSKTISNNAVTKIFEDSRGDFWIGTKVGLNRFDKKSRKFERFFHDPQTITSLSNNEIFSIYEDKQKNLWIGTAEGLNLYNRESSTFIKFLPDQNDESSLSENKVRCTLEDRKGRFWVGTFDGGLNLFDRKTHKFKHFKYNPAIKNGLNNNTIVDLMEDEKGMLWIGTEMGGLNVFDADNQQFYHFLHDTSNPGSISNNSLYSIYKDRQGLIWIGTFAGGVNYFDKNNIRFTDFNSDITNPSALTDNSVLDLLEDSSGNLWIATDGGGLNLYDKQNNTFQKFKHDPVSKNSISKNEVLSIKEEKKGFYWVGAWNGGLNLFDREKNIFTHYLHNPADPTSLSSNNVMSLLKDHKGDLWVATFGGGLNLLDRKKNNFKRYKYNPKNPKSIQDDYVLVMYEDSYHNFWLGTFNSGLVLFDRSKEEFTHFRNDIKDSSSISNDIVHVIFEDSKKNLWVGTRGGGLNLFNRRRKTFKAYTKADGLPNDVVHGIQEDSHGNLWLSTNFGICKFNPETGACKNYTHGDGLQSNEFNRRSFLKTKDGRMFFGGILGFNSFHPDSIKINNYKPPVVFTDFQVFNKSVLNNERSLLSKPIGLTKEIVMSYKESVFSFVFSALSFTNSHNNQYAFKLEGFDRDWNYVGTRRGTTYTNIPAGSYVFRVKASNNDGVWNEEGATIKIIITPPFWQTWWFRLLLSASIIGVGFSLYKARVNLINKQKEELEQQVQRRTLDLIEASVEIKTQRDNFKILNEQVMSSINYANTIQKAILPTKEKIQSTVSDYFIIYKPKDVVSGDFYWFNNLSLTDTDSNSESPSNIRFIVVADCMGHGVPGAFMSIIGNILFNEVIIQRNILDPSQILDAVDQRLRNLVSPSDGVNIAGMDVCLCKIEEIDHQLVKVCYAGARRPLFFVRKGQEETEKLASNIISVGSDFKEDQAFEKHELILKKGAVLYLTTDGLMDQNNEAKEKFGTARFMALIKTIYHLPLAEQKDLLEKALLKHQKNTEQRDDITIVGVRI